jgi:hypothetical protein
VNCVDSKYGRVAQVVARVAYNDKPGPYFLKW